MSALLKNLDEAEEQFQSGEATWVAVRDANAQPFILSADEDGDVFYVGVPFALDEAGTKVDDNRGFLANPGQDTDGPRWPLLVLGTEVSPESEEER